MPKLDLSKIPAHSWSNYPGKLASFVEGRANQWIGDAGGLTQFGVTRTQLEPGAYSSMRHYHANQDEFVVVTEGICTLIDDNGEYDMHPGDCATFPAGDQNGHHFANRTEAPAAFVVVGTRTPTETAYYSDHDLKVDIENGDYTFSRKDGSPLTADQIGDDQ